MKQQPDSDIAGNAASSGGKRVATRDLVRIGQRWQRRSRKKIKPAPMVIYQVHRGERAVRAYPDGDVSARLTRISFADLRAKYKLLDDNPQGGRT